MIKAILFDFDGTLADTTAGILKTMEETFREMGKEIPDSEEMKKTIGIPLRKALQQLNNLTDEETDTAMQKYNSLFKKFEVTLVSIFPQVKETLEYFRSKGIRMAVATSRNRESLELITKSRGIDEFFETMFTHDNGLKPKPAPDMVLALLDHMNLSADEAIVVGDTTYDIEMGNGAGCKTIAVTYGNHSREVLESVNPTYIINSFEELKEIVMV